MSKLPWLPAARRRHVLVWVASPVVAALARPRLAAAAAVPRYELLHSFSGGDGFKSQSALVAGPGGTLIGTAFGGGAIGRGDGTAFRLAPDGRLTLLYSFDGERSGEAPAGLTPGRDGAWYGVTTRGGQHLQGTIFRLDAAGRVTLLHAFGGPDGSTPQARLLQASDGRFYGSTSYGGAHGSGCVFRIAPDGRFSVLHAFDDDGEDGIGPGQAGLMQASDGGLYGVTHGGGRHGQGTLFRLQSDGALSVLHAFEGPEGRAPASALVEGPDGRLYGTAAWGGALQRGTVYRLERDGSVMVLHDFSGREGDGAEPVGDLILARDGWLYGVTERGGRRDGGTVYRMNLDGRFERLHAFDPAGAGGYTPRAGLVETADGSFVGTTYQGGGHDAGGIFRLRLR